MFIKLALPKGRLQAETAALLDKAGLGIADYRTGSRNYHLACPQLPGLAAKVFHEKDIPIQVAVGNYDLGICGQDWTEELVVKYRSSPVVKLMALDYGEGNLYLTASKQSPLSRLDQFNNGMDDMRIATEYPNLAESLALKFRLRSFRIFPLWGAAEAYPPECADLALVRETSVAHLDSLDLVPVLRLMSAKALLIANRQSWETKDMSAVLKPLFLHKVDSETESPLSFMTQTQAKTSRKTTSETKLWESAVRLALPDGHQHPPTAQFLKRAHLAIDGYDERIAQRRPSTSIAGVSVKVIRPQDMPSQVANGNFDLAISGRDWLYDHLYRFPSSPVEELVELGYGKVKIVAVVSNELPARSVQDLRQLISSGRLDVLRVASEYVNIADKYARDNHLSPYRLIPTWGASEAFLPQDADLLVENSQTGQTLARHNLRVIDTLFHSSACLIGSKDSLRQKEKVAELVDMMRATLKRSG